MKSYDQAATLRGMPEANVITLPAGRKRFIAVSGGKGGVGKSTFSVNLAVTYALRGSKTIAFDGDFGMADLNLLLGTAPSTSMLDLLAGMPIEDVVVEAHGIDLLPGLNGSHRLANLPIGERERLFDEIANVARRYETVIVDTAAGISEDTTALTSCASEVVIVANPDPLSLADAYACLKVLSTRHAVRRALLVPNSVRAPRDGAEIVAQLTTLVRRFLNLELVPLPEIPYDPAVQFAGATGVPLVITRPDSAASRAIQRIARAIDALAVATTDEGRPT
jgi:flagellar biosynthesis protein FlhG